MRLLRPSVLLLAASTETPTYLSAASSVPASTAPKPSGIATGDVVIVIVANTVPGLTLVTSGGTAWARNEITWLQHGYTSVAFYKILNATDVTNNWGMSANAGSDAFAWRDTDAAVVAVRSTTAAATTNLSSLTLAGFTPANSRFTVSICVDRDNDIVPVAPTGFVSRYGAIAGDSNWSIGMADKDNYAGGNVTWTGLLGSFEFAEVGWLIEVTGP